jgi:glucose dehydrogenase
VKAKTQAMARWQKFLFGFAITFATGAGLPAQDQVTTSVSTTVDVQPVRLLTSPVAENWLSYNGDFTGRRFSALHEITTFKFQQPRSHAGGRGRSHVRYCGQ